MKKRINITSVEYANNLKFYPNWYIYKIDISATF